jgi:hypothetical protein
MKLWIFLALLVGSTFASVCPSQSTPVCGSDYKDYLNESNMSSGVLVAYCYGTCYQYHIFKSSNYVYNSTNGTWQFNSSDRSYMERFVSSGVGRLVGNQAQGKDITALLVGIGFFTFMSFQNMRIESKIVIIIPALALSAYFVGWIISFLALLMGLILFFGLSRIFNR